MKVLVVVDVQNDFTYSALRNEEAIKRIPKIIEKIKQRQNEGWKLIFTKDTHFDNYLHTFEGKRLPIPHCIKGTEGWEIVPEILAVAEKPYMIIEKNTFGATNLGRVINGMVEPHDYIEKIEIVGFVSSICIAANAILLRAEYPNIPISVDASCCAGLAKEDHDASMLVMKQQMIDITGEEK